MEGIAAIIVSLGTLIGAVGAAVIAYRNSQGVAAAKVAAEIARQEAADAKREIVLTKSGVFEVGKAIDGRLTALLELTRKSALAEGRLQGAIGGKATDPIEVASDAVDAAEDAISDAIVVEAANGGEGHI